MIVLYIQCTDYSISFISFYINCFWQSRISRSDRRGTGRRTPRISCLPCQRRTTQSIRAGKISPQTSSPNYFKHTDSIFYRVTPTQNAYPNSVRFFIFSFDICWYAFNLFYLHLPFEWHVNVSVDRITGPCGFGFGDRLRGWWKRRRSRITSRNSWTHRVSQKVYANLICEAPTFRVKKKNKALQI